MKKTYVTTVPNHIGAFLSASRLLAALDINITRVSYNKAVDSHTIFIEAEGSRQQLAQADEQLAAIGYLRSGGAEKSVVLLEFQLRDVPGGVTDILACIERFSIMKDHVELFLDTSGVSLHKRGYRREANLAPLHETMAAAMVNLARYRGRDFFWDPFCGSGTICIEAAMIALNRAPGLNREFAPPVHCTGVRAESREAR